MVTVPLCLPLLLLPPPPSPSHFSSPSPPPHPPPTPSPLCSLCSIHHCSLLLLWETISSPSFLYPSPIPFGAPWLFSILPPKVTLWPPSFSWPRHCPEVISLSFSCHQVSFSDWFNSCSCLQFLPRGSLLNQHYSPPPLAAASYFLTDCHMPWCDHLWGSHWWHPAWTWLQPLWGSHWWLPEWTWLQRLWSLTLLTPSMDLITTHSVSSPLEDKGPFRGKHAVRAVKMGQLRQGSSSKRMGTLFFFPHFFFF